MSVQVQRCGGLRAEDLAAMDGMNKFVEIIDGDLITLTPAGKFHNRVAYNIAKLFDRFCARRPELDFGCDNDGFLLSRDPDTLLSPDASLYRRRPDREKTWLEFAPEIVVEVVSPSNTRQTIAFKRGRFFQAGAEQFWIVDPDLRSVEFVFADGRRLVVQGEETIAGEGVAAGLEIDLAEIFKAN